MIVTVDPDIIVHSTQFVKRFDLTIVIVHPVKCSFQKAFNNGETRFRKPISCHLFPIRISGEKRNIMKYEELYECHAALEKGKDENVTIFEFSKDSLIREYGEDLYNDLREKFSEKK